MSFGRVILLELEFIHFDLLLEKNSYISQKKNILHKIAHLELDSSQADRLMHLINQHLSTDLLNIFCSCGNYAEFSQSTVEQEPLCPRCVLFCFF